jgi:hypothetical protein
MTRVSATWPRTVNVLPNGIALLRQVRIIRCEASAENEIEVNPERAGVKHVGRVSFLGRV